MPASIAALGFDKDSIRTGVRSSVHSRPRLTTDSTLAAVRRPLLEISAPSSGPSHRRRSSARSRHQRTLLSHGHPVYDGLLTAREVPPAHFPPHPNVSQPRASAPAHQNVGNAAEIIAGIGTSFDACDSIEVDERSTFGESVKVFHLRKRWKRAQ
ncbi:hypothetical protein EVAR_35762_1 [Eumeta japonica]|uniref:Uncharacterized protein n=1 Tax=Eumeta variegata TaxID=151549 RepID=A0A4C1WNH6_EUMVA|nr:hypothetical protein EVAR_35762_1 [Eumeta japonica]